MYTYVSSFLRMYGKNQTWQNADISAMLMKNIFSTFFDGYIIMTNTGGTYYMDLQDLKKVQETAPYLPGLTFNQWLSYIGGVTLTATTIQPTYVTSNALYSSAAQSNYKVTRYGINGIGNNDLSLTKPLIDYTALASFVLTSVNGFYHRCVPIDGGLGIPYGAISGDISKRYQVGLLSFANIGAVQQIALNAGMFGRYDNNIPYSSTVYVELGVDLTNKSVLLSLGGYLHCNDKTYDVIDPANGLIRINLNRITLADRLFEMKKYLDLSQLGLSTSTIRPDAFNLEEIDIDSTAIAFLSLPQSFAIVVDAPMLYVNPRTLRPVGKLVGMYDSNGEPLFPLRTNTGRQLEYHRTQEFGVWTVQCDRNISYNQLYRTSPWENNRVLVDGPDEVRAFIPDAHLYGIYSTVKAA